MQHRMQGFTLIELMIVIVVVAILAAIAVPSYRSYMLRTNRTEAKAVLLQVLSAQEKFFLQNNSYAGAAQLTPAPPNGLGLPATTANGGYVVSIAPGATPGTTYVATATAAGGQLQDTDCQTFTIDEMGARNSAPSAVGTCWR